MGLFLYRRGPPAVPQAARNTLCNVLVLKVQIVLDRLHCIAIRCPSRLLDCLSIFGLHFIPPALVER
jgi:hypothetical protein